jgi:peptidoglycan/LPS O-acetylase OafA/YrhL
VILFHINPLLLPGGFVGVDIFFVISGYLISLHIYKEIENGQFSLAEFYRRRIKRIAPAMLVVLGITVILAQFILLPEDAEKIAESSLWSLASMANVYFWLLQDTSYFAAASNELPLLHLWSLGVEEQFYIFWPLILMLVYKSVNKFRFALSISIIALLSFALGCGGKVYLATK